MFLILFWQFSLIRQERNNSQYCVFIFLRSNLSRNSICDNDTFETMKKKKETKLKRKEFIYDEFCLMTSCIKWLRTFEHRKKNKEWNEIELSFCVSLMVYHWIFIVSLYGNDFGSECHFTQKTVNTRRLRRNSFIDCVYMW